MNPERDRLSAVANEATLRANQAQERAAAWSRVARAVLLLLLAYEGNSLHPTIKKWYDAIAKEKSERQDKLYAIIEKERETAARAIDTLNETPHF